MFIITNLDLLNFGSIICREHQIFRGANLHFGVYNLRKGLHLREFDLSPHMIDPELDGSRLVPGQGDNVTFLD